VTGDDGLVIVVVAGAIAVTVIGDGIGGEEGREQRCWIAEGGGHVRARVVGCVVVF